MSTHTELDESPGPHHGSGPGGGVGAGCGEGRCCRRACRLTASDSPGTPEGVPCSDAMALCADTRLAKFTKPPLQRPCSSRSTCAAQRACVGVGAADARAGSFHEDTGLTAGSPLHLPAHEMDIHSRRSALHCHAAFRPGQRRHLHAHDCAVGREALVQV